MLGHPGRDRMHGPPSPSRSSGRTSARVQRGNDRQPCFARDDDYLRYRQELGEAARKHVCDVHAYVLVTNHVRAL